MPSKKRKRIVEVVDSSDSDQSGSSSSGLIITKSRVRKKRVKTNKKVKAAEKVPICRTKRRPGTSDSEDADSEYER